MPHPFIHSFHKQLHKAFCVSGTLLGSEMKNYEQGKLVLVILNYHSLRQRKQGNKHWNNYHWYFEFFKESKSLGEKRGDLLKYIIQERILWSGNILTVSRKLWQNSPWKWQGDEKYVSISSFKNIMCKGPGGVLFV